MKRRKWLRRGAFLLIFLVALYLLFWWALFNPLEGDVESLSALIPERVTYLIHSPFGKLRASDLYRAGLLDSPLLKGVEGKDGQEGREGLEQILDLPATLYQPIQDIERQVNEQVPGILGTFSVLDDVMGEEILLAGNLTGPGDDLESRVGNSPYVLLTRISFKAKFMEVLRYGFVRDEIPGLEAYRDYYRYDMGEEILRPGSPEEARYVYFRRIRDVLAISNDRELIEDVVLLGLAGGGKSQSSENLPGGNFYYFYDIGNLSQEAGITAWFRLSKLDYELEGEFEGVGRRSEGGFADLLRNFFPVGFTNSITLELGAEGKDVLPLKGGVRMLQADTFPAHLYSIHHTQGESLTERARQWASFAPARGNLGFTWLNMAAEDFLKTLCYTVDEVTRDLLFDERDGWSADQMSSELGDWFDDGVAVAWARLPEVAGQNFDTYAGGEILPMPAVTFFLTRKGALTEQALVDFFVRNADRLGFEQPKELEAPVGRLFTATWPRDRKLVLQDPGFAVVGDTFMYSTNLGELRRILEVMAGRGEALITTARFSSALARANDVGNLFAYVDGRVLREHLLDLRWEWAFDATTVNEQDVFREERKRLESLHPNWEMGRLNEEATRGVRRRREQRELVDFPDAVKLYRRSLGAAESLDWLGFSLHVSGDAAGKRVLRLKGALKLQTADETETDKGGR